MLREKTGGRGKEILSKLRGALPERMEAKLISYQWFQQHSLHLEDLAFLQTQATQLSSSRWTIGISADEQFLLLRLEEALLVQFPHYKICKNQPKWRFPPHSTLCEARPLPQLQGLGHCCQPQRWDLVCFGSSASSKVESGTRSTEELKHVVQKRD